MAQALPYKRHRWCGPGGCRVFAGWRRRESRLRRAEYGKGRVRQQRGPVRLASLGQLVRGHGHGVPPDIEEFGAGQRRLDHAGWPEEPRELERRIAVDLDFEALPP